MKENILAIFAYIAASYRIETKCSNNRNFEYEPNIRPIISVYLCLLCSSQAMEKCVEEGLVKNIGVSNFNSLQFQDIIDNCSIKPAVHQVRHYHVNYDLIIKIFSHLVLYL